MKQYSIWITLALVLVAGRGAEGASPKSVALQLGLVDRAALQRALDDLVVAAPDRYTDVEELRRQVAAIPGDVKGLASAAKTNAAALIQAEAILALQRRILLANPLLDFDKTLAVKRSTRNLGLPANYSSNSQISPQGYDNEIIEISLHGKAPLRTVFRPAGSQFIGDLCLHFNADRLLFSMPNTNNQWQVFEMGIDGAGVHQVTPGVEAGSGNYDACYLPSGDILFSSTVPRTSVPCVNGSIHVSNLFRLDAATGIMRQLCFDQEHNWTPRILPNGTVLYQRWEYTDTPHSNTRLLFTMNPDGTSQRAFYGSNSYWPTAFFYAQPIPGKANLVVGISSGHHGPARTGELILLDVGQGRYEAEGVVQKIPGFGQKVEPRIYDHMDNVWPDFIHPCPLSEKYFLVSCRPSPAHNWGLYLVDVFDNLLLIQDFDGYAVLEPVAVEKRPVPPVLPDKVDLARKDATIYIQDIYEGGGLKGIPRGTVTSLRVFTYTFSYPNVGGLYGVIGMDGPWDMRRVLGTVPVEPDGSVLFKAPANTPIAIQPLDKEGRALALMRSWMTAMPGENLSCVGCHERENSTPPSRSSLALKRQPSDLKPWRAQPVMGFSFEREVQPVLNRYCVSCHKPGGSDPDLESGKRLTGWHSAFAGSGGPYGGRFSTSYANLFPFVRNNGIEGDYHLLAPMEFHFSTTDLGKLLRKGHYGVELDGDAWARLVTWADLNRPYHGTWSSIVGEPAIKAEALRAEARRKYAGLDVNHEDPVPVETVKQPPVIPHPPKPVENPLVTIPGWPFDEARAKALQGSDGPLKLDLGNGATMELVRIPAGEFAMGSATGHRDEQPVSRTRIAKPFWMARLEVSNGQYGLFDPSHDSGCADAICYQFGRRPWPLDQAGKPVCRVSWREAMAFCDWVSRKTGRKVTLPTEAQWEWACRAGTATPYSFGGTNADYVSFANFGDKSLSRFAADTSAQEYHGMHIMENPGPYDAYIPRDETRNDGNQLSAHPGSYKPNAWGLYDMHGNVAEWTRSSYESYPCRDDSRNTLKADGRERVVRGGSWWSRPFMGTSSWRVPFADYQPVMEVGFRVIVED